MNAVIWWRLSNTMRVLACKSNVRQKFGGINKSVSDMAQDVEENVRMTAMRLVQTEDVRTDGAPGLAGEEYAAEVVMSHSGTEAAGLTEPGPNEAGVSLCSTSLMPSTS